MSQIELHNKINSILRSDAKDLEAEEIATLIHANPDARQFFFSRADERWLTWLWENGFLDSIKLKSETPTRYSYSSPELAYLEKVVQKDPKTVTDIILNVTITPDTFNPEVIDRFCRIAGKLPVAELIRIVPKIREERWIPLMGVFNQFGFEYERMFQILSEAKEYETILILAEAVLTLRTKDEMASDARQYINENPFYFSELRYTKVFEYLTLVDDGAKEKAFQLLTGLLEKIILKTPSGNTKVFAKDETFHLLNVDDFTTLSLFGQQPGSSNEDVVMLVAAIKILAEQLVKTKCNNNRDIEDFYTKLLAPLPDSSTFWRLRLFVFSLCPAGFKEEIKLVLPRIFVENYHELNTIEYKNLLLNGFIVLDDIDKRQYVQDVFTFFGKKVDDHHVQEWLTRDGLKIMSCICGQLTEKEQEECLTIFGQKCDPTYQPKVPPRDIYAGTVHARAPLTLEELGKMPIPSICNKLKNNWTPAQLRPQNQAEDFLHPLNAEGVGSLLKEDMTQRLQEYVSNAEKFFDREKLDAHYTYAFFRGIEEIIRESKVRIDDINWMGIIILCLQIQGSGEKQPFEDTNRGERDIYGGWLASWMAIHSVMADVLLKLTTEKDGKIPFEFGDCRDNLLGIIQYLFTQQDPNLKDEKIETAKHKVKSPGQDYELGDPFTTAINSVRGRAFQVLTNFVYLDGKKYSNDDTVKIAKDVKKIYEEVLERENTQAVMFMFGHYLPSYYYRDKAWMRGLLSQVFPEMTEKLDLYLAAWEGYLATSLYEEMFADPAIKKLYYRAIDNNPDEYTKRRYTTELDEGLAVHLALAFMYYEFGFDNDLFKKFWNASNTDRSSGFIGFIGRSFVSGDNKQSEKLLGEKPAAKQKIQHFWDWALEHCKEIEALKEFGFWMNAEKGVFELSWQAERAKRTLEKTGGIVEWDFGLMRSMPTFAKNAPTQTLEILRQLLLLGGIRSKRMQRPFYMENESFEAFKILYQDGDENFKKKIYTLIDDLIREGGSTFWRLKDVVEEK